MGAVYSKQHWPSLSKFTVSVSIIIEQLQQQPILLWLSRRNVIRPAAKLRLAAMDPELLFGDSASHQKDEEMGVSLTEQERETKDDENRLWRVGMRRPANGGRRNVVAGLIRLQQLSNTAWYLRPGTCSVQQMSWTTADWQLKWGNRGEANQKQDVPFHCISQQGTHSVAWFSVSLPSLLYMQVLFGFFFPPSLCFSFHWWQTVPPVQFNSYHTL